MIVLLRDWGRVGRGIVVEEKTVNHDAGEDAHHRTCAAAGNEQTQLAQEHSAGNGGRDGSYESVGWNRCGGTQIQARRRGFLWSYGQRSLKRTKFE
jgi:hypothetical protein